MYNMGINYNSIMIGQQVAEHDDVAKAKYTTSANLATKIVISGTDIYVGKATIGSATSASVWQVKKIDTATDIIITWAGAGQYNQIFDNYAGLTYA